MSITSAPWQSSTHGQCPLYRSINESWEVAGRVAVVAVSETVHIVNPCLVVCLE